MKRGGGSGGISLPFLMSALDRGEWLASRPGRFTSRYPFNRTLGWPQGRSVRYGEEKNIVNPGNRTPAFQHVTRLYPCLYARTGRSESKQTTEKIWSHTVTLPVTSPPSLMEAHSVGVWGLGAEANTWTWAKEVTGRSRKSLIVGLYNLYPSSTFISVIKSSSIAWEGHVACVG
jgi:hypothetical protein